MVIRPNRPRKILNEKLDYDKLFKKSVMLFLVVIDSGNSKFRLQRFHLRC